jgi:hypothetical protein
LARASARRGLGLAEDDPALGVRHPSLGIVPAPSPDILTEINVAPAIAAGSSS